MLIETKQEWDSYQYKGLDDPSFNLIVSKLFSEAGYNLIQIKTFTDGTEYLLFSDKECTKASLVVRRGDWILLEQTSDIVSRKSKHEKAVVLTDEEFSTKV